MIHTESCEINCCNIPQSLLDGGHNITNFNNDTPPIIADDFHGVMDNLDKYRRPYYKNNNIRLKCNQSSDVQVTFLHLQNSSGELTTLDNWNNIVYHTNVIQLKYQTKIKGILCIWLQADDTLQVVVSMKICVTLI